MPLVTGRPNNSSWYCFLYSVYTTTPQNSNMMRAQGILIIVCDNTILLKILLCKSLTISKQWLACGQKVCHRSITKLILTRRRCYHQACTWSPTVMGTVAKPPHLPSRLNQWINIIWHYNITGLWTTIIMAFDKENVTCCVVSPLLQRLSQQKSNTRTDLDTIPVLVLAAGHEKFFKILSGFGSLTQCNARTLYHNNHYTYTYWISWADVWHQPHLGWRRGLPRPDSADNLSWTADPPTYRERQTRKVKPHKAIMAVIIYGNAIVTFLGVLNT